MHHPSSKIVRALGVLGCVALFAGCAVGRDDNPPGPRGGPGTNWENPPGPRGGPGASPDRHPMRRLVLAGRSIDFDPVGEGYYYNPGYGYWHPRFGLWDQAGRCWRDPDNNPPGPAGGRGTNWENPPGLRGGPGASPDRFGRCH